MWYSRVVANLDAIPDFIAHYEREITDAKKDCRIAGIVEKNMPIHQSNIAIFNATTGKADRVGIKSLADGKRVRVYKSSGEEIKVA